MDALGPDLLELLVGDLLEVLVEAWREMFASLLDYDDTDQLPGISAPAMLIWGDADPLVPQQMQDELLGLLPIAELRTYASTGHTPRWQHPERFARDVAAFAQQAFS